MKISTAARRESEDREAERLRGYLPVSKLRKERVEKGVAKSFLMHGKFFYNGELYEPRVKHLGLGVYEVWAESE